MSFRQSVFQKNIEFSNWSLFFFSIDVMPMHNYNFKSFHSAVSLRYMYEDSCSFSYRKIHRQIVQFYNYNSKRTSVCVFIFFPPAKLAIVYFSFIDMTAQKYTQLACYLSQQLRNITITSLDNLLSMQNA